MPAANGLPKNARLRVKDGYDIVAFGSWLPLEVKQAVDAVCRQEGLIKTKFYERAVINYLADNYPDHLPARYL